MRFTFGFKKIVAALTALFFSWESAVGYALPIPNSPVVRPKHATLILNAHTSSDAQKSIAELLESFRSQGIDLIGLEGADEKIDGAIFRKFPAKDVLAKAAWQMVKEGIFTGAEHFYITADRLPRFYGIEDKGLYLENRDAFIKTLKAKEALRPELEALQAALKKSKSSIYSKELSKLDQLIERHEAGEISFLDYFLGLVHVSKTAQIALPSFPSAYALAKALEEEKGISAEGLKKDTAAIRLSLRAREDEAISEIASSFENELLAMTALVTGEGGMPHSTDEIFENYQKIRSFFSPLIEQNKIDLQKYKHLARYWSWLGRINQVESRQLFDEISALTDLLFERMVRTEEEKQLVKEADDFKRFQKLISIELTQKEWKSVSQDQCHFWDDMTQACLSARSFYELAEQRNEIFARNIVKNMEVRRKNHSAIVLGGFHEEGLRAALEAKGVSVSVVSPKIENAVSDIPYFERMLSSSTLEQALKISGLVPEGERQYAWKVLRGLVAEITNGDAGARSASADSNRSASPQASSQTLLFQSQSPALSPFPHSSFIKSPYAKARTANEYTTILTGIGNEVKKLLAYAAAKVIENTLSMTRWIKSFLAAVKNVRFSGFITGSSIKDNSIKINNILFFNHISAFVTARSEARTKQIKVSPKDVQFPIVIGTAGWRATDKQGFTLGNVARFAQAVAIFQNEDPNLDPEIKKLPIAVGYDARPKVRDYAVRLVEAIAGYWLRNGIGTRVDLIDQVTPTPVVGETTRRDQPEDERYGIALHVTASHNPVYAKLKPREQWLGIKIFINGLPAPDLITDKIVAIANDLERSKSYRRAPYQDIPLSLTRRGVDLVEQSAKRIRQAFKFPEFKERLRKANFKIAFNNMRGSNALLAETIFSELAELGIVHQLMNMNPMSEGHPLTVRKSSGEEVIWAPDPAKPWFVGEEPGMDKPGILLLRSDGDADRLVVRDIDGKTEIDPNSLGLIFAHFLYQQGERGIIVRTAPTTRGLDRFAQMRGLELKTTGVGSKNFAEYADQLLVAVEESGHIFFRINGEMFADHSLAAALLVMKIAATTGKSLSEYLDDIWAEIEKETGQKRLYHYNKEIPSQFVTAELKQKVLAIRDSEPLRRQFAETLASKINIEKPDVIGFSLEDKIGFGIEFPSFWVMPRNSGTENKVRIYFEMPAGIDPQTMERALTDTLLEVAQEVRSEVRPPISRSETRAKGLKQFLLEGWVMANHKLVSFHAAFFTGLIQTVFEWMREQAEITLAAVAVFLASEVPISLLLAYLTWHTVISVHEMGHFFTAKKKDLVIGLEVDLEKEVKIPFREYLEAFLKIPYGKFKGVIKEHGNYYVDTKMPNLAVAAAGPIWGQRLSRFTLLPGLALFVSAVIFYPPFAAPLMLLLGRLMLGIGVVSYLDITRTDDGAWRKYQQEKSRKPAEEAAQTQTKGAFADVSFKEFFLNNRMMDPVVNVNGETLLLPWQFRNTVQGGRHVEKQGGNVSFQEFMLVPVAPDLVTATAWVNQIQDRVVWIMRNAEPDKGLKFVGNGIEGGVVGTFKGYEEQVLDVLMQAVSDVQVDDGKGGKRRLVPGKDVFFALDPAMSELANAYVADTNTERVGYYKFWMRTDRKVMTSAEMVDYLESLVNRYPIMSIEDGMAENDWEGWKLLKQRLGERVFGVGDDLVTTNEDVIRKANEEGVIDTVLIKANQIGTLSETMLGVLEAWKWGNQLIISHRSKSGPDDFETSLALAWNALGAKFGGAKNAERQLKWNRFLEEFDLAARKIAVPPIGSDVKIIDFVARQIPTNEGQPTVEVTIMLSNGSIFKSSVPIGSSAGSGEAVHLVDGGVAYDGKGNLNAVRNVNELIAPLFLGKTLGELGDLEDIDVQLLSLEKHSLLEQGLMDGKTSQVDQKKALQRKALMGMNALLPVSIAMGKVLAAREGLAFWEYIRRETNRGVHRDYLYGFSAKSESELVQHRSEARATSFYFPERIGRDMQRQLGEKAVLLAQFIQYLKRFHMAVSVPPFFAIPDASARNMIQEEEPFSRATRSGLRRALARLGKDAGEQYGDKGNPLFVSLRASPIRFSPGQYLTVLNLGVNDETLAGLAKRLASEELAKSVYVKLIKDFLTDIHGFSEERVFSEIGKIKVEPSGSIQTDLLNAYKTVYQDLVHRPFPQHVYAQMRMVLQAIYTAPPRYTTLSSGQFAGGAVVQRMVFGVGANSFAGEVFSRNPETGTRIMMGNIEAGVQGDETTGLTRLDADFFRNYPQLSAYLNQILTYGEQFLQDAVRLEITIEKGKPYLLQIRRAERTHEAQATLIMDLIYRHIIREAEAYKMAKEVDVQALQKKSRIVNKPDLVRIAKGILVAPGVAVGHPVISEQGIKEARKKGIPYILVKPEIRAHDKEAIDRSNGVVSLEQVGNHAESLALRAGVPAVLGIDYQSVDFGSGKIVLIANGSALTLDAMDFSQYLTIDSDGAVYFGKGEIVTEPRQPSEEIGRFIEWKRNWEERMRKRVPSADTPLYISDEAIEQAVRQVFSAKPRSEEEFAFQLWENYRSLDEIEYGGSVPSGVVFTNAEEAGARYLRRVFEESPERVIGAMFFDPESRPVPHKAWRVAFKHKVIKELDAETREKFFKLAIEKSMEKGNHTVNNFILAQVLGEVIKEDSPFMGSLFAQLTPEQRGWFLEALYELYEYRQLKQRTEDPDLPTPAELTAFLTDAVVKAGLDFEIPPLPYGKRRDRDWKVIEEPEQKQVILKWLSRSEARAPLKILFADEPGAMDQIKVFVNANPERIEIVGDAGVGKNPDQLRKAIEETNPDIVFIRSTTKAFQDKNFVNLLSGKIILRGGTDTDNVDLDAAREAGVIVARTGGAENSVANLFLRFFITYLKTVSKSAFDSDTEIDFSNEEKWKEILDLAPSDFFRALEAAQKRGAIKMEQSRFLFSPFIPTRAVSKELQRFFMGDSFGFIGFGNIPFAINGKLNQISEMVLPPGRNARVLAYSPSLMNPSSDEGRALKKAMVSAVQPAALHDILDQAGVISLHLPGRAGTVLGNQEFRILAKRAGPVALINTSRSSLIDHEALLKTLQEKPDLYYFADIDLIKDGKIIEILETLRTQFPNRVFLTPHIGASTPDAVRGVEASTLSALEEFFDVYTEAKAFSEAEVNYVVPPPESILFPLPFGRRSEAREMKTILVLSPSEATREFFKISILDANLPFEVKTARGLKEAVKILNAPHNGVDAIVADYHPQLKWLRHYGVPVFVRKSPRGKSVEDIQKKLGEHIAAVYEGDQWFNQIMGDLRAGALGRSEARLTFKDFKNEEARKFILESGDLIGAGTIEFLDDSDEPRLRQEEIEAGGLLKVKDKNGKDTGNHFARSHVKDTARLVKRTFTATDDPNDKGLFNNWRPAKRLKKAILAKMNGALQGKTLYVIPYLMGPPGSPLSEVGIQLTDDRYVALNMIRMTRVGRIALNELERTGTFTRGVHVTGDLDKLRINQRYFAAFPAENLILSFGSAYGGNALLSKKFHALRMASYRYWKDKQKGKMRVAEHMAKIEILDTKTGQARYASAAFPSASGKSNFGMMQPPLVFAGRYRIRMVSDDILWIENRNGRPLGWNPEDGVFPVVPGTNEKTNPHMMKAIGPGTNTIDTNEAYNEKTGEIWWEGLTPDYPENLDGWLDWRGKPIAKRPKDRQRNKKYPWAHPNARATTKLKNVPVLAEESVDGHPLHLVLYGGRVAKGVPLIYVPEYPDDGVYDGAVMGVLGTAAASGEAGKFLRDPFAMRPFFSTTEADFIQQELDFADSLDPEHRWTIAHVNWFLQDPGTGRFLWPGFGENIRPILWALELRERGGETMVREGRAKKTPIGYVPTPKGLNLEGLDIPAGDLEKVLEYDVDFWSQEIPARRKFLESLGKVPARIWAAQERLERAHQAYLAARSEAREEDEEPKKAWWEDKSVVTLKLLKQASEAMFAIGFAMADILMLDLAHYFPSSVAPRYEFLTKFVDPLLAPVFAVVLGLGAMFVGQKFKERIKDTVTRVRQEQPGPLWVLPRKVAVALKNDFKKALRTQMNEQSKMITEQVTKREISRRLFARRARSFKDGLIEMFDSIGRSFPDANGVVMTGETVIREVEAGNIQIDIIETVPQGGYVFQFTKVSGGAFEQPLKPVTMQPSKGKERRIQVLINQLRNGNRELKNAKGAVMELWHRVNRSEARRPKGKDDQPVDLERLRAEVESLRREVDNHPVPHKDSILDDLDEVLTMIAAGQLDRLKAIGALSQAKDLFPSVNEDSTPAAGQIRKHFLGVLALVEHKKKKDPFRNRHGREHRSEARVGKASIRKDQEFVRVEIDEGSFTLAEILDQVNQEAEVPETKIGTIRAEIGGQSIIIFKTQKDKKFNKGDKLFLQIVEEGTESETGDEYDIVPIDTAVQKPPAPPAEEAPQDQAHDRLILAIGQLVQFLGASFQDSIFTHRKASIEDLKSGGAIQIGIQKFDRDYQFLFISRDRSVKSKKSPVIGHDIKPSDTHALWKVLVDEMVKDVQEDKLSKTNFGPKIYALWRRLNRSEARNLDTDQTEINRSARVSSIVFQSRAEARERPSLKDEDLQGLPDRLKVAVEFFYDPAFDEIPSLFVEGEPDHLPQGGRADEWARKGNLFGAVSLSLSGAFHLIKEYYFVKRLMEEHLIVKKVALGNLATDLNYRILKIAVFVKQLLENSERYYETFPQISEFVNADALLKIQGLLPELINHTESVVELMDKKYEEYYAQALLTDQGDEAAEKLKSDIISDIQQARKYLEVDSDYNESLLMAENEIGNSAYDVGAWIIENIRVALIAPRPGGRRSAAIFMEDHPAPQYLASALKKIRRSEAREISGGGDAVVTRKSGPEQLRIEERSGYRQSSSSLEGINGADVLTRESYQVSGQAVESLVNTLATDSSIHSFLSSSLSSRSENVTAATYRIHPQTKDDKRNPSGRTIDPTISIPNSTVPAFNRKDLSVLRRSPASSNIFIPPTEDNYMKVIEDMQENNILAVRSEARSTLDPALGVELAPGVFVLESVVVQALELIYPTAMLEHEEFREMNPQDYFQFLEIIKQTAPEIYRKMNKGRLGRDRLNQALQQSPTLYFLDKQSALEDPGGVRDRLKIAATTAALSKLSDPDYSFFYGMLSFAMSALNFTTLGNEELDQIVQFGKSDLLNTRDQTRLEQSVSDVKKQAGQLYQRMVEEFEHHFGALPPEITDPDARSEAREWAFDQNFRNEMIERITKAQEYFEQLLKEPRAVKHEFERLQVEIDDPQDVDSFRRHLASIRVFIESSLWPYAYELIAKVDMRIKFMDSRLRDRNETFRNFANEIEALHNRIATLLARLAGAGIDFDVLFPWPDDLEFDDDTPRSEARGRRGETVREIVGKLFSNSVDEIVYDLLGSPEFLSKLFGEDDYERLVKALERMKSRILKDHQYDLDAAYESAQAAIDRASYHTNVDQIILSLNKPTHPVKRKGEISSKYPELAEKASAGIIRLFQKHQTMKALPPVRILAREVGISRVTLNLHYRSVLGALKLKIAERDFNPALGARIKTAIERYEGKRSEARTEVGEFFVYLDKTEDPGLARIEKLVKRIESDSVLRPIVERIAKVLSTSVEPRIQLDLEPNLKAVEYDLLRDEEKEIVAGGLTITGDQPGKEVGDFQLVRIILNSDFADDEQLFFTFVHELVETAVALELIDRYKFSPDELQIVLSSGYTDWLTYVRQWMWSDQFGWTENKDASLALALLIFQSFSRTYLFMGVYPTISDLMGRDNEDKSLTEFEKFVKKLAEDVMAVTMQVYMTAAMHRAGEDTFNLISAALKSSKEEGKLSERIAEGWHILGELIDGETQERLISMADDLIPPSETTGRSEARDIRNQPYHLKRAKEILESYVGKDILVKLTVRRKGSRSKDREEKIGQIMEVQGTRRSSIRNHEGVDAHVIIVTLRDRDGKKSTILFAPARTSPGSMIMSSSDYYYSLFDVEPLHDELVQKGALDRAEQTKRRYIVGGNWKMAVNTKAEAIKLLREIAALLNTEDMKDVDVVAAPSAIHLHAVSDALNELISKGEIQKGRILLGAQDLSEFEPGAHTSETSYRQLQDTGVTHVIIGYSERRRGDEKKPLDERLTESSKVVNAKVKQALVQGLIPIVAVGENQSERESGETFKVIERQIRESLKDLTAEQMKNVVLAYEPVWAIGTGLSATPEQANEIQRFIRGLLLDTFGYETAAQTRIQYGGSVKPSNAGELIAQPNIDGGLIGGAALKAEDFVTIIRAMAQARSEAREISGEGIKDDGGAYAAAGNYRIELLQALEEKEKGRRRIRNISNLLDSSLTPLAVEQQDSRAQQQSKYDTQPYNSQPVGLVSNKESSYQRGQIQVNPVNENLNQIFPLLSGKHVGNDNLDIYKSQELIISKLKPPRSEARIVSFEDLEEELAPVLEERAQAIGRGDLQILFDDFLIVQLMVDGGKILLPTGAEGMAKVARIGIENSKMYQVGASDAIEIVAHGNQVLLTKLMTRSEAREVLKVRFNITRHEKKMSDGSQFAIAPLENLTPAEKNKLNFLLKSQLQEGDYAFMAHGQYTALGKIALLDVSAIPDDSPLKALAEKNLIQLGKLSQAGVKGAETPMPNIIRWIELFPLVTDDFGDQLKRQNPSMHPGDVIFDHLSSWIPLHYQEPVSISTFKGGKNIEAVEWEPVSPSGKKDVVLELRITYRTRSEARENVTDAQRNQIAKPEPERSVSAVREPFSEVVQKRVESEIQPPLRMDDQTVEDRSELRFVNEIRLEGQSKTVVVRLTTDQVESLNDPSDPKTQQFFKTTFAVAQLGHRIQLAVSNPDQELSLRQKLEDFRLANGIVLPKEGRVGAEYFAPASQLLARTFNNGATAATYLITDAAEAASIEKGNLVLMDRAMNAGKMERLAATPLQALQLAVGVLHNPEQFHTQSENGRNVLIAEQSFLESVSAYLSSFLQKSRLILSAA